MKQHLTPKQQKKRRNKIIIISLGLIVLFIVGGYAIWFYGFSSQSPFAQTPTTANSTFQVFSKVDGEDVSDFLELSIWTPKSTTTFDETEDIFTLSNFEEDKSSMDAEDISIDLSGVEYAWVEIDPDGEQVFANNFILLYGGANYAYKLYAYDQSTDVNFIICDDDTMAGITVGNLTMDSGYVILLDVPHDTETAAQLHVGTNWDMEQSEFDDLTTTEQAEFYKEELWSGQYPTYDPAVDTAKEYYRDLEKITNAFAIKLDFNATISTVDGNTAQVNCTVDSAYDVEVVISGDLIYLIWTVGIEFDTGVQTLPITIDTASAIGLDNAYSGRIVVPQDDDNLGTFTALSTMGS